MAVVAALREKSQVFLTKMKKKNMMSECGKRDEEKIRE
jgi:hypothetical protein